MFEANVRKVNDVMIIECRGKLFAGDATTAFTRTVMNLSAENRKNLLLNFKDLAGIDSGGIGTILSVLVSIEKRGGKLKLACPDGRVRERLQRMSLLGADMFDAYKTEEEAMKKFSE